MTPTEQDKELQKQVVKCFTDTEMEHDQELTLFDTDQTIENLMQLITADRKRVALEARLYDNERTLAHIQNGMPVERLKVVVEKRISELKAQQGDK